ncbi:putative oxidoreductase TM_0325 [Anticarsia gemmatalis]|uniref:putative oxidoreductase TM_0325 n=1 Tax=Anticarsia gemmatalis TaxID=129554 RepID=UPI003F76D1E1
MGFADKVVIITGASSGIGAATAIKFAEHKAKVVIVARTESKLKEVAAKCEKHGTKPLIIVADVTKDNDIKNIVSTTISKLGKIDVLVNNAGIGGNAAIWDDKAMEVFDKLMATNLRSIVFLTNLAAPHLIKTKGNIINISSVAGMEVLRAECFSYCTSKAALDHFTRSVALDLGPKGVRVNTVNPGPVKTDFISNLGIDKANHDKFWKNIGTMTILKRVSEPEEIADLVLFVASDKARAITGSSILTDNGMALFRDIKLEP